MAALEGILAHFHFRCLSLKAIGARPSSANRISEGPSIMDLERARFVIRMHRERKGERERE